MVVMISAYTRSAKASPTDTHLFQNQNDKAKTTKGFILVG